MEVDVHDETMLPSWWFEGVDEERAEAMYEHVIERMESWQDNHYDDPDYLVMGTMQYRLLGKYFQWNLGSESTRARIADFKAMFGVDIVVVPGPMCEFVRSDRQYAIDKIINDD